jgi:SAM-dependent methyltransferase
MPEILDGPDVSEDVRAHAHRDLTRTHRWLGHTRAVLRALRRHRGPLGRVLDIGCGHGALLEEIRRRLCVDVVGIDLNPPNSAPVPMLRGDAVHDPLPACDAAVAVCLVHHLSEGELRQLIQNVRRSARRFVVLDLVRHPAPLALFRAFVAPWVHWINAADGITSIRRSFTGPELRAIAREAAGPCARIRHVSRLFTRTSCSIFPGRTVASCGPQK